MFRRKPTRDRLGDASFGRRIPRCNFASIRAEIEVMQEIASLEADSKSIAIFNDPVIFEVENNDLIKSSKLKSEK